MKPLGGQLLQHLGDRLAQLVDGRGVLDQRHRPSLGHQHHQRHRGDLHRLGDLRHRVDVDPAEQEPALELVGQRLQVAGELHALGRPARALEGEQDRCAARALEQLLEVLLGHGDGVRRARTRRSGARGGPRTVRSLQSGQIDRTWSGKWLLAHDSIVSGPSFCCTIAPRPTILRPVAWGETGDSSVPAVVRWTGWSAGLIFVMLLSRSLVVEPDKRLPDRTLVRRRPGVAGQCPRPPRAPRRRRPDHASITVVVLALTDGTAMQIVLSLLFVLQPLAVIYLLRRWTPHLWGGGRAPGDGHDGRLRPRPPRDERRRPRLLPAAHGPR